MSTDRPPVTNIVFGTMTLGYYRGYGSRVHATATRPHAEYVLRCGLPSLGYRARRTICFGGGIQR